MEIFPKFSRTIITQLETIYNCVGNISTLQIALWARKRYSRLVNSQRHVLMWQRIRSQRLKSRAALKFQRGIRLWFGKNAVVWFMWRWIIHCKCAQRDEEHEANSLARRRWKAWRIQMEQAGKNGCSWWIYLAWRNRETHCAATSLEPLRCFLEKSSISVALRLEFVGSAENVVLFFFHRPDTKQALWTPESISKTVSRILR